MHNAAPVMVEDFMLENERQAAAVDSEYKRFLTDLHTVAKSPEGARVICWYLSKLGTFDPAWSAKNPQLARAVVLKDFGQSILDDLAVAADGVHDEIQRMMRIRRKAAEVNDIFGTERM